MSSRFKKIENILMKRTYNSSDEWKLKLCDFGSVVDGKRRICKTKFEMDEEQHKIERFTTPSYRPPEMVELFQRLPLSTKVDIWALGVILFILAFLHDPFPDGSKMQILGCNYQIPAKHPYSNKITNLIKLLLVKDPEHRPTAIQIISYVEDVLNGGNGTLSKTKRATSLVVKSERLTTHKKKKKKGNKKEKIMRSKNKRYKKKRMKKKNAE